MYCFIPHMQTTYIKLSKKSHKPYLDISASKNKQKRAAPRADRKRTIKLMRQKISHHQSQIIEDKLHNWKH